MDLRMNEEQRAKRSGGFRFHLVRGDACGNLSGCKFGIILR